MSELEIVPIARLSSLSLRFDAIEHQSWNVELSRGNSGVAPRHVVFARNLLGTLRQRELDALGEKLSHVMNMPFQSSAAGEYVAGTYRQRFTLAFGRFAMVDDGLGFQLVPWTPSIERHIGQHISGIVRQDGGVDWSFGRKRGLGL
jgi:hypothetical protein